jgi:hypothetical protein
MENVLVSADRFKWRVWMELCCWGDSFPGRMDGFDSLSVRFYMDWLNGKGLFYREEKFPSW